MGPADTYTELALQKRGGQKAESKKGAKPAAAMCQSSGVCRAAAWNPELWEQCCLVGPSSSGVLCSSMTQGCSALSTAGDMGRAEPYAASTPADGTSAPVSAAALLFLPCRLVFTLCGWHMLHRAYRQVQRACISPWNLHKQVTCFNCVLLVQEKLQEGWRKQYFLPVPDRHFTIPSPPPALHLNPQGRVVRKICLSVFMHRCREKKNWQD